jgi:hypothetical protein
MDYLQVKIWKEMTVTYCQVQSMTSVHATKYVKDALGSEEGGRQSGQNSKLVHLGDKRKVLPLHQPTRYMDICQDVVNTCRTVGGNSENGIFSVILSLDIHYANL